MQVKTIQEEIDQWIKTYGVRYFEPLTNLGILMEEVGELSRVMVRHYGEQSFKEEKSTAEIRQLLKDEWADTFWVLVALANQMDIDIEEVYQANMQKKIDRDKDRHLSNKKLKE